MLNPNSGDIRSTSRACAAFWSRWGRGEGPFIPDDDDDDDDDILTCGARFVLPNGQAVRVRQVDSAAVHAPRCRVTEIILV
jgi:hypothetical protein